MMNSPMELRQALTDLAADHKLVEDTVRDLARLLTADAPNLPAIQTALNTISLTANRHFASEESLMADLEYPRLPAHRVNHQWFRTFMNTYQSGVALGTIRINDDARRNLPNLIRFYAGCHDNQFENWLAASHGWRQVPAWLRTPQASACHA